MMIDYITNVERQNRWSISQSLGNHWIKLIDPLKYDKTNRTLRQLNQARLFFLCFQLKTCK